jgi:hypothetical protein
MEAIEVEFGCLGHWGYVSGWQENSTYCEDFCSLRDKCVALCPKDESRAIWFGNNRQVGIADRRSHQRGFRSPASPSIGSNPGGPAPAGEVPK